MWAFDSNCLKPPNGCCFHEPVVFINVFNPHKSSGLNHHTSAPSSMPFISNFDFSYPKCHVFESHCRYQRIQSRWLLGWIFLFAFFLTRQRDRRARWKESALNGCFFCFPQHNKLGLNRVGDDRVKWRCGGWQESRPRFVKALDVRLFVGASRVFVSPFAGVPRLRCTWYIQAPSQASSPAPSASRPAGQVLSLSISRPCPFHLLRCIQLGCPCCDYSIIVDVYLRNAGMLDKNNRLRLRGSCELCTSWRLEVNVV